MACNYPITAYKCAVTIGNRLKYEIVFDARKGDVVQELRLPCGVCIGCRLEKSRQWAMRCMHEAQMHDRNSFITLTYNKEHLPEYGNLCYDDFQKFMKRLRKKFKGTRIRFFMCGEYGENRDRPHFHACIFGIDFDDRVYFKTTASGSKIYTSATLDALWSDKAKRPIGFCTVGDVNFASAGYVARYIMKKRLGRGSAEDLREIDYETGEVFQKESEFNRMSLKPGIGADFFDKWYSDIFPQDICVVNGVETKPPRYYYKKLRELDPQLHEDLSWARALKSLNHAEDNTDERRLVKEKVLEAKMKFLKRELIKT